MSFLWPEMLWLMLLVPALVLVYGWLLRRKKKFALQYASLSLVKEALGKRRTWQQHVPPVPDWSPTVRIRRRTSG